MALSDYLEEALLNHVFGGVPYTAPTTVYLALMTAGPDDEATFTEVTGGSYARQAVTFSAANNPAGTIQNNASVTFTNMPACTVVGTATMDDLTTGNVLTYSALGTPRVVSAAENLNIAIGDFTVGAD